MIIDLRLCPRSSCVGGRGAGGGVLTEVIVRLGAEAIEHAQPARAAITSAGARATTPTAWHRPEPLDESWRTVPDGMKMIPALVPMSARPPP